MVKQEVNQDTIELLKECDAGCNMAIESMEQINRYVTNDQLKALITKYNGAHIKLEEDIHRLLNNMGEEGQEPSPLERMGAWAQTELKMSMNGDIKKAADILTNGCNMGIKSLCEYKNTYKTADEKSVALCEKLCDIESHMVEDLQTFL